MTGAVSDEKLMALADGELPDDEAAELRALINADPDLAERYALFAETAALLAPEGGEKEAAVPDHLRAAVLRMANEAAAVAAQPHARFAVVGGGKNEQPAPTADTAATTVRRSAAPVSQWRMAMAASIALLIGGVAGYGLRGGNDQGMGGDLALVDGARSVLASALQTAPSGEVKRWTDPRTGATGTVAVIATHRMADGNFCREAEVAASTGTEKQLIVSCRRDGNWKTQAIIASAGRGSIVPASGAQGAAEQLLETLGSQGALSESQEKAFLAGR